MAQTDWDEVEQAESCWTADVFLVVTLVDNIYCIPDESGGEKNVSSTTVLSSKKDIEEREIVESDDECTESIDALLDMIDSVSEI